MKIPSRLLPALSAAVLACGAEKSAQQPPEQDGPIPPAPAAMQAPGGAVDTDLAERGAQLFQAKGCIGCHTIGGGRLTGPDLAGVTERRERGWVIAMITNPDSMIRNDPTARQLFAEYMTPMANMGLTAEEARAIYEHLRAPR